MTGFNLPPGCETHHIPGNRPIDRIWDKWFENNIDEVFEEYEEEKLTDDAVKEYDKNKTFRSYADDRFQDWYETKEEEKWERQSEAMRGL